MCHTKQYGPLTVCFSRHALQRAAELCMTPEQIEDVLTAPGEWARSRKHRSYNQSSRTHTVCVGECGDHWVALTFLPANEAEWRKAMRRKQLPPERAFDPSRLPARLRTN